MKSYTHHARPPTRIGIEPIGHRYAPRVYTCTVCGFKTERITGNNTFMPHIGRPDCARHPGDGELCGGSYERPVSPKGGVS